MASLSSDKVSIAMEVQAMSLSTTELEVIQWLHSIGFERHQQNFVTAGIFSLTVVLDITSVDDLQELGIPKIPARTLMKHILELKAHGFTAPQLKGSAGEDQQAREEKEKKQLLLQAVTEEKNTAITRLKSILATPGAATATDGRCWLVLGAVFNERSAHLHFLRQSSAGPPPAGWQLKFITQVQQQLMTVLHGDTQNLLADLGKHLFDPLLGWNVVTRSPISGRQVPNYAIIDSFLSRAKKFCEGIKPAGGNSEDQQAREEKEKKQLLLQAVTEEKNTAITRLKSILATPGAATATDGRCWLVLGAVFNERSAHLHFLRQSSAGPPPAGWQLKFITQVQQQLMTVLHGDTQNLLADLGKHLFDPLLGWNVVTRSPISGRQVPNYAIIDSFLSRAKKFCEGKVESYWKSNPGGLQPKTKRELQEWIKEYDGGVKHHGEANTWDVSLVTDMKELFKDMKKFNAPIDQWNTSQVTDMNGMFEGASSFNQPITMDTSKVTDMSYMFRGASSFNQPITMDTSQVTDMTYMFYGATEMTYPLPDPPHNPPPLPASSVVAKSHSHYYLKCSDACTEYFDDDKGNYGTLIQYCVPFENWSPDVSNFF